MARWGIRSRLATNIGRSDAIVIVGSGGRGARASLPPLNVDAEGIDGMWAIRANRGRVRG